jgi:serine/threonine protein kinase
MFMEYVVGGELFTHLRDAGRFNDTAARFYAAEVLLAIDYLHARNVVYRDLKVKPLNAKPHQPYPIRILPNRCHHHYMLGQLRSHPHRPVPSITDDVIRSLSPVANPVR